MSLAVTIQWRVKTKNLYQSNAMKKKPATFYKCLVTTVYRKTKSFCSVAVTSFKETTSSSATPFHCPQRKQYVWVTTLSTPWKNYSQHCVEETCLQVWELSLFLSALPLPIFSILCHLSPLSPPHHFFSFLYAWIWWLVHMQNKIWIIKRRDCRLHRAEWVLLKWGCVFYRQESTKWKCITHDT